MDAIKENRTIIKGGEFVIETEDVSRIFFPEDASDDQKMIISSLQDFIDSEIKPKLKLIENREFHHTVKIIENLGKMGFLGLHMPEKYGGMELDTNTDILVSELVGGLNSFNVSYSVQVGIGMLPLLFFGTEKQKEKYLTQIISGEIKPAYCLTEPTAGSDALSVKTYATLSDHNDGYILNGQKMWISNSGFANLFIVFAKIKGEGLEDSEKGFTGFLVDAQTDGITLGAEEEKMGIHGSSTRQVFFENVKIPKENVLGEIGKGHLIAFNVLNIGRLKLGVLCISGSKSLIDVSVKYANDRIQFKKPISTFGAIKQKLAEQTIRTFVGESTLYRTSSLMNHKSEELISTGVSYGRAKLESAQEYAIECAILKVFGSEIIDFVVDEAVQIHGGMGFSEETVVAGAYRDARINRIFEGTNEINRLLSINMLLKRAQNGEFDLTGPAWEVQKELTSFPKPEMSDDPMAIEIKAVKDFKKLFLLVAGAAVKKQMDGEINLEEKQEIVIGLADMLIDTYASESALLRIQKVKNHKNENLTDLYTAMLKVYLHDASARMAKNARDIIASISSGDLLKTFDMGVKRFTGYPLQNVLVLRRKIADKVIAENSYPFYL